MAMGPFEGLRYSRSRRESELTDEDSCFLNNFKTKSPELSGGVLCYTLGVNASSWFLPKFPSG
jgi:hypothetical protein